MSYKKTGSIIYQVKARFRDLDAFGKKKPKGSDMIHSYGTMQTYLKHSIEFVKYCRKEHNCKTLEECKPYIKEYIEGNEYSPWVKKVQRSAICKMYGIKSSDLEEIDTGERSRTKAKRSRGVAVRDKHFSETGKYKKYVDFCKGTGLRKSEIEALRGNTLYEVEGKFFLKVTEGTKGGKHREVPILSDYVDLVKSVCIEAGEGLVIPFIASDRLSAPNGADTHSYRSSYAKKMYDELKRPLDQIPPKEKYFCRGDLKGTIYDKKAMEKVSNALGHNRLSVISQSYLR